MSDRLKADLWVVVWVELAATVAGGANPAQLRWNYTGAQNVEIDKDGNLAIKLAPPRGRDTEDRMLTKQALIAWQELMGRRVPVTVAYAVAAGNTRSSNFPLAAGSTYSGSNDAFVAKVFPEVDQSSQCRWPHTPGVTTNLTYRWGSGLTTLGTQVRLDMEAALANWNTQSTRIRFVESSTGAITLEAYSFPDGTYGTTFVTCSGSTTTSVLIKINTYENRPSYLRTVAHELGHAMSVGHIFSSTGALMNYSSATTTPLPFDREFINFVYP